MLILVGPKYANSHALVDCLGERSRATDFILTDEKRKKEGVALFLNDEEGIFFASRYKVGAKAATNRSRIVFDKPFWLDQPIPMNALYSKLPQHRRFLVDGVVATEFYFVTPVTSEKAWAEIVTLSPALEGYFASEGKKRTPSSYDLQRLEYDAIALPLRIAGIEEVEFTSDDPNASIFDRIVGESIQEDQMLAHDYGVLSNPVTWAEDFHCKSIRNAKDGSLVHLWYANRSNLEKLFGVDLILYHVANQSFLMIQYKRMRKEGEEQVYRIDGQLDEEISRMEAVRAKIPSNSGSRLNQDPFYLRFCWQKQDMECYSRTELLKGMNLPLSCFQAYRADRRFLTDRGAEVIRKESIERYLDNSRFIELFNDGWIGSSAINSNLIAQYAKASLDQNNSILVAQI
jgi:hypothetical protein